MTLLVQGAGKEELAGKSPRDGGAATGTDWTVFQTKSKSVDEQVNIIITISSAVNDRPIRVKVSVQYAILHECESSNRLLTCLREEIAL